jgi:hypothetical protein
VIIWGTGALVADADADDQDHARYVELMRRTPRPLLIPSLRPGNSRPSSLKLVLAVADGPPQRDSVRLSASDLLPADNRKLGEERWVF